MRDARFQRQAQRLRIHMSHHQKHAVPFIGDDSRDEAGSVEARHEYRTFFYRLFIGRLGREGRHCLA